MAKNSPQIDVKINFEADGAKKIESTVLGLVKNIEGLQKSSETILKGNPGKSKEFSDSMTGTYNTAKKLYGKVKEFQKALSESDPTKQLSNSEATGMFRKLVQDISVTTQRLAGFKQALSATTEGTALNVKNLITQFRSLGVSGDALSTINSKFKEAQQILKKTGDDSFLRVLNKDLEKSQSNFIKLEDAITKLNSLDIKSKKVANTTYGLEEAKQGVITGELSPQKTNALIKEANKLYTEQSTKQKELLGIQENSAKVLKSSINTLADQKQKLTELAQSSKASESPKFLSEVNAQIKAIDSRMTKLQGLTLISPSSLSTAGITAYVKKIDEAVSGIDKLTLVTSRLKPSVATEEVNFLTKKAKLINDIIKAEETAKASSGNTLNPSDAASIISQLENLKVQAVNSTNSVSLLVSKLKSIRDTMSGKITYDTAYDKILSNYNEQINSLQRLIAVKEKWASNKTLKEAAVQVEVLTLKFKEARDAKDQFNRAFDKDPSKAILTAAHSTQQLNKQLNESKNVGRDVAAELNKIDAIKWIENIGKRAMAYASLYGGIYSVITLLKDGVKYALEFDQGVHTLSAVLDMTADSAGRLENRLAGLGTKFGGNLKDINNTALALGRAGFDKSEVATATENIMKMARLTGDSFDTSASALITYKEVFGDVVDSMSGAIPTVEGLSDMLAYMANQSRLSTQDIGTFSNYALAAAKSSGMTAEAVSAMAISFSNAGVNASTIGTQIRRFSSVLADTSTDVTSFFKSMGVSQEMMMARMKMGTTESNAAMAEFVAKLKSMSDSEFGSITRGMDILALQSLTLLRNNADEFFRHLQKLNAGVSGEIDKANFVTESYAITWEKLGNSLGLAFNGVISSLLPAAKSATESLISLFNGVSKAITKVTENWEQFKDRFLVAMGLITAAVTAFSLRVILSALGSAALAAAAFGHAAVLAFTEAAAAGTLLSLSLKGVQTALLTIGKHPVILALTAIAGAAAYAMSGLNDVSGAVSNLAAQDKLDAAIEKVRTLQELRKNAKGEEAYKIDIEINHAQFAVDNLTKALNINSAALDSKSSIDNAISFARAYAAPESNPTLTAVAGDKAQQGIVNALTAISSTLEATLKATDVKDTAKRAEITKMITEVGLSTKKAQSADFSSDKNKGAMTGWIDHLNSLNIAATKLGSSFTGLISSVDISKISTAGLKDNMREIMRLSANRGVLPSQISDSNTRTLATLKTQVDMLAGKTLTLNSAGRSPEYNASVGGAKDSQHLTGQAIDIGVKSYAEGLQLMQLIRDNQKSMANLGQVILETNKKTGSYWLHLGKSIDGAKPTFSHGVVAKNGNATYTAAPNLAAMAGAIDTSATTTKRRIVSPEYIADLKSITSDLMTKFQNKENVTTPVKQQIALLDDTIAKLGVEKGDMLNTMISSAVTKDAKEVALIFAKELTAAKTPAESITAYENLRTNVANKAATADAPGQKMLFGVEEDAKKFKQGAVDILDLEASRIKLKELGQASIAAEVDLTAELYKFNADILKLEREKGQLSIAYEAALNNQVYAISDTAIATKEVAEQQKISMESTQRLSDLEEARIDIANRISAFNLEGNSSLEQKLALEESSKLVEERIAEEYRTQSESLKTLGSLQNNLLGLKTVELNQTRQLSAEYANIVYESGTALANLERIADLSNRKKTGQSDAEAMAQSTGIYKKQFTDSKRTIEARDFTEEGNSAVTTQQQYDLSQNITQSFNQLSDAALMQLQTFYDRASTLKANLQHGEASGMTPQQKIAAIEELNTLEIQMTTTKNDIMISEAARVAAFEQVQWGIRIQNTQTSLSTMNSIVGAAQAMGLIKSKHAANVMKGIAVGQAIMSTYVAANKAMETYPYPMSLVAAAGAIAQGMQQVSAIRAQTFHTGGYVANDNRAGLRSDEVPAVLQTGEYVLSRKDMAAIKDNRNSGTTQSAPASKSEVVVVNSLDPSVIEQYLSSRAGRQIINNAIR